MWGIELHPVWSKKGGLEGRWRLLEELTKKKQFNSSHMVIFGLSLTCLEIRE
jgi:hypothetical protein